MENFKDYKMQLQDGASPEKLAPVGKTVKQIWNNQQGDNNQEGDIMNCKMFTKYS